MKVLVYDPQITVQRAWQLSSNVEQAVSLDDLFTRSDAVTVHVPLNDQTRGLVNSTRLGLMRPGGVILPSWAIDVVALAPGGAHPSYAHGYTERDNDFYVSWAAISRDRDAFRRWMEEHVLAA